MLNDRRFVALCTSRVYEPAVHGFVIRLNERLKAQGYTLLIFSLNSDIYWEEDRVATERYVFDIIPYRFLDAVIIMDEKIKSHKIANKIIKKANDHRLPVVIADGYYDNCSCIRFDYEKGFEQVVRHVIEEHGVKRPHIMAGHVGNEFSDSRIEVFRKVIEQNGIPFDESMVSHGDFWADPCRIAMRELLKREVLPDAIICANDIMAITVAEMLKEEGIQVPGDVIVSGFDGYDEIYFNTPKITTAICDIIKLADVTSDVLFKMISTGSIYNESIVPSLLTNSSCGCPEQEEFPSTLRNRFRESFARLNDDNRVLQIMSASMQMSNSVSQMVSYIESYKTVDTIVVADRRAFEGDSNYFTDIIPPDYTRNFSVLYDSDYPGSYKEDSFSFPDIDTETEDVFALPVRDRLCELSEEGFPLIFNSLDLMNRPLGFVCYHFRNDLISNYTNSVSVTNALCIGIGGYINLRYQRMLLRQVDEMYRHDALTGLYNRIGFQNALDRLIKDTDHYGQRVTVIMSDLDGLKFINDNFGHAEGDNAIQKVAHAVSSSVPEYSLTTRFGGDEVFSVIFDKCNPEEIIGSINSNLEEYNETSGKPYTVTTSCGYTTAILDEKFDISHAVKEADKQMYIIKSTKKNS